MTIEKRICEFCGKGFYAGQLRKHKLKDHVDQYKCEYVCQICGEQFESYNRLSSHLTRSHSDTITHEQYYIKYLLDTVGKKEKSCKWCGKELEFNNLQNGYKSFCHNTKCNVLWHNKYEKRAKVGGEVNKELYNTGKKLSPMHVKYWLDKGFTEEEAKQKVHKRQQTFSKEKCIAKYGEELGVKKFAERQQKWQDKLNSKSFEEKQEINKKKISFASRYNGISVSIAERELKEKLQCYSQLILKRDDCPLNYAYDLYNEKKIIEYNGDYWHCNPNKYDKYHYHKRKHKYAHDIWESDSKKINYAGRLGYIVLVIWESEWKENKQQVIDKCREFLYG